MKEININIEGYNVNGICVGCLNYNRKMFYDDDVKDCFKLIGNIDVPDGLTIQVCWECLAAVKKVIKFQTQILNSYDILIEYSQQHTFLDSPEDFTQHAATSLSTVYVPCMGTTGAADDCNNEFEIKDELKEESETNAAIVDNNSEKEERENQDDSQFSEDFLSQDQDVQNTSSDEDIKLSSLRKKKPKKERKKKKLIKNDAYKSIRSIVIGSESDEPDLPVLISDEKTDRSTPVETTKNDGAEILSDPLNFDFDNDGTTEKNVLENSAKTSKSTRHRWDRRNCCLYCEKLVTNFTRHLIRHHQEEIEVLKLMSIKDPDLKVQKQKRQAITDDLRNRGNYIHNSKVVANNEGQLLPARRKNDEEFTKHPSRFVVCKKCLGTYRRPTFYRHYKNCNPGGKNDSSWKKSLARHALSIIPTFTHVSKEFKNNIMPRLRHDDISLVVKQDPLIIAYGCRLLKRKKERSRKAIISKLRDLGNLLQIVRGKNPDIVQLQQLIHPKFYNHFIHAVKIMSGFDEGTGKVKVISVPARIRTAILGCIEILFTNTIVDSNKPTALKDRIKKQLSEFKQLLEVNWKWEISNAESRKPNLIVKSQEMPLEQDMKKLMIKIHDLEDEYYNTLKIDITDVNYENLCEVTIAHIILLDRKRSVEVAEVELQYYLNRKTDEIPPQVLEILDVNQKQAISDLDIFRIPDKLGRLVPIILTKIMRRNIDAIIACRSLFNISSENKYLFARMLTNKPFGGVRCLNKIKRLCVLEKVQMLTATGLPDQQQTATVSTVKAKTNDKHTQHLATLVGHDANAHASNYTLPIKTMQKGLVGGRLHEIEKHSKIQKDLSDKQTKNIDQNHSEIQSDSSDNQTESEIDEINVSPSYIKENENNENGNTEKAVTGKVNNKRKILNYKSRIINAIEHVQSKSELKVTTLKRTLSKETINDESATDDDSDENVPKQKIRKMKRNKWSEAEIEAVMRNLKMYIVTRKNPGKVVCEEVLRKEPVLHQRTWMHINTYINNIYKKKK